MPRTLQMSLIIACTTLTVLATGTMLHDANGHPLSATRQLFGKTWRAMTDVFSSAQPGASAATAIPATNTREEPDVGTNQTNPEPSQADVSSAMHSLGFSEADWSRLSQIGTEFASSLTKADWARLANDFGVTGSGVSEDTAAQDVEQLVQTHMPSSDMAWVLQHFQGSQSFNQQDVQLLQGAVTQMKQQLTPDEMSLLENNLANWFANQQTH